MNCCVCCANVVYWIECHNQNTTSNITRLAVASRELARAQLLARRARLLGLNLTYDDDDDCYYDGVDD